MKVVTDFSKTIEVPKEGIKAKNERIIIPARFRKEIDRVLISPECLRLRIKKLAAEVCKYSKNIYAVILLRGSIVFFSDLMRVIPYDVRFDVMKVSSYVGTEPGKIKIGLDVSSEVKGDVLLVEDIVDTGISSAWIKEYLLKKRHVKSVKICTLLDKPARREKEVELDWIGFRIPNYFIVGFGIDYNQRFRNLPFIAVLRAQVFRK